MRWKVGCPFLLVILSTMILTAHAELPPKPGMMAKYGFGILPEPQLLRVTGQSFQFTPQTTLYLKGGERDRFALHLLRKRIAELTQLDLRVSSSLPERDGVILEIVPEARLAEIPTGNPRREGYILEVEDHLIRVRAAHSPGLFYGVQSFLQLVDWSGRSLRGLRIVDWPDMEFRAVHISTWYRLDRPWYYQRCFEQLSRYKINAVVFELEDKFSYSRHPTLSAPGALTAEQVQEMVGYANQYFVEIVPLVQTMGHVAFIAKHPEFSHLREVPMSNWQLCPLKPGMLELAGDILDEMIEATPGTKYFHIGGDEARELGQGAECQAKWGGRAAIESYKLWFNFVCARLKSHGRIAIVWDDMFLRHFSDEDMRDLPDNVIYMRWNYEAGDFPEDEKKILRLQYPVWIATSAQTMTPVFPDQGLRAYNNSNLIPAAFRLGIKGVVNTAWEDAGAHFETFWMGFVCSAEYAWSSQAPPLPEFREKFFRLFYGRQASRLAKVYDTLSRTGFVREEWSWAEDFRQLTLPPLLDEDFHVKSDWADKNQKLVQTAKERELQYLEALRTLEENLRKESPNKYNLEVLRLAAKTLLHFTHVILRLDEINANLIGAEADHRAGNDQAAINRYHKIGRIIDDLMLAQRELYEETVKVWEHASYPKDFRHISGGRERYLHQVDRDFYYANKTMDLSYIFEVENRLGLFAYQQALYETLVKILRGKTPW